MNQIIEIYLPRIIFLHSHFILTYSSSSGFSLAPALNKPLNQTVGLLKLNTLTLGENVKIALSK